MRQFFSSHPGAYERHIIRQYDHPKLFKVSNLEQTKLKEAQQKDQQDAEAFQEKLVGLVQKAIDLESQTDSQILLDLKADLEQAYTYACSLSGDQSVNKQSLNQLITVLLSTINGQIEQDTLAIKEMQMEKEAREIHFKMIENPLIADLLREFSPIPPNQLLETLLSESIDSCYQCLSMFDDDQIVTLIEQGLLLEQRLSKQNAWLDQYQNNLANMGQIVKDIAEQIKH